MPTVLDLILDNGEVADTPEMPLIRVHRERDDLQVLIFNTPNDGRAFVERYHSSVIDRLDSGSVIPVPSRMHRDLHQLMWIMGMKIYRGLASRSEAARLYMEEHQRERFDVWYVQKYVLSRKLTPWEMSLLRAAQQEAMEFYKHPLELFELAA
ncbi:hypothetical protein J4464_03920 [Candidatus Woesearchaeota archaeon]|nr:hypothetical protein [Candidatus Woesearchaeota archaeon]